MAQSRAPETSFECHKLAVKHRNGEGQSIWRCSDCGDDFPTRNKRDVHRRKCANRQSLTIKFKNKVVTVERDMDAGNMFRCICNDPKCRKRYDHIPRFRAHAKGVDWLGEESDGGGSVSEVDNQITYQANAPTWGEEGDGGGSVPEVDDQIIRQVATPTLGEEEGNGDGSVLEVDDQIVHQRATQTRAEDVNISLVCSPLLCVVPRHPH